MLNLAHTEPLLPKGCVFRLAPGAKGKTGDELIKNSALSACPIKFPTCRDYLTGVPRALAGGEY
jgi:hypothetical protein